MTSNLQDTLGKFEPINKAHAIVEAVFFCEFDDDLERVAIDRLIALENDEEAVLRKELPKIKLIQGGGFQISHQAQALQQIELESIGVLLEHYRSDGANDWTVRTLPHAVSVHSLEYTTWKEVSAKVYPYFYEICNTILPTSRKIEKIGLKYVDQFRYDGSIETYDNEFLFSKDTKFIHKHAFSSGTRWHCHNGWYETPVLFGDKPFDCLNQVNIDAFLKNSEPWTKIEHSQAIGDLNISVEELTNSSNGQSILSECMEYLHKANKDLLKDLLTPTMIKRISL